MNPRDDRPRVLIRVIISPHAQRGERLAVYVDARTVGNPSVLVYSLTHDHWRVEPHRQLMWRSRRGTPTERAEAHETLVQIGEHVRILQSAPRAIDATIDGADESPADDADD